MYKAHFYPMRLALLTVGRNFMPMAWWTPVSKDPFRFLLAVDRKNHTLTLLRELEEGALCFLPWEERAWVVRAGYLTGRKADKAERLAVALRPARVLQRTLVPEKALAVYELRTVEWPTDGDHALFLGEVVLEAHTYPGGLAGSLHHRGVFLDTGATLLSGFAPGGPMRLLEEALGLSFPVEPLPEGFPLMAVHLEGPSSAPWGGRRNGRRPCPSPMGPSPAWPSAPPGTSWKTPRPRPGRPSGC
ncbi:flavin reductase family protein [Thermus oshimai]|uniref:flavin reductase family protein n=1 Tax=Thermus oshimai TaxID=56957 RepID=UPI0003AAAB65|nr:flavin reductase [Thermus oshimai]